MKKIHMSVLASTILLFNACGGSSSDTTATVTGQFVDTYVEGLNYTCSSGTTGITNSAGEYTCNEGDTVEFSLGAYVLGSVTASAGIVTPELLYPDNAEAALNVAQVIQSLDADPTDDIITIPENFTDLDDVTVTPEDTNFDALIEDELNVPLVTEEVAQTHLDETELILLLGGKTFYNVGSDWIDRMVFNADVTSLTWEQIVGGNVGITGTDSLALDGNQVIVTSGEDGSTFNVVLGEETADYLVMHIVDTNGAIIEVNRFYFDQAKAEAYYDSLQPVVDPDPSIDYVALLGGKTFYSVEADYIDRLVINTDVTSSTWETLAGVNTGDASTDTLFIDGTDLVINMEEYITLGEETTDYLLFNVFLLNGTADGQVRLYFDQAKAEAYYDSLQPVVEPIPTIDYVALLGGKTFYNVGSDWIDRMVFNADVTSLTWEQIVGGNVGITGTDSLALDGNQVIVTSGEDGSTFNVVLGEETADYLVMNIVDTNGAIIEVNRFYFDQVKAEAYYDSLQPDLVALMVGNTFYQSVQDSTQIPSEWIAEMTVNPDGTLVIVDNGQPETMDYTIDGNTLTMITITEGTQVHTLTDATDTYLEFDNSIDGTWYFTLEAAQAAPAVIW